MKTIFLLLIISTSSFGEVLVYQNNFDSVESLRDWKLEGNGKVKIKEGALSLKSIFWKKTHKYYLQHRNTQTGIIKKRKLDKKIKNLKWLSGKSSSYGHIVFWNKSELPKNYKLTYDFKSESEIGLFILFFNAKSKNGKDIFDSSLKSRNGKFSQYVNGDINNYHISYHAKNYGVVRGMSNLRKNSGFKLASSGEDVAAMNSKKWLKIELIKQGSHITFSVDGEVVIEHKDKENVYHNGKVGFRHMLQGNGLYDNLKIYEL